MAIPHIRPTFGYRRSTDQDASSGQDGPAPVRRPVVVVGAGPTGLSMAIDLALHGVPVVLLDDGDTVSPGSRAVCYAKRTLEVWDRLGVGEAVVAQGVGWRCGWVHHDNRLVYEFDLLTEAGHKMPAFTNLQQYLLEEALVARAHELAGIELRWRNRLIGLIVAPDHVALQVDTPEGPYQLQCEWLIAADGARSVARRQARPAVHWPDHPRPLPDLRCRDRRRFPEPAAVLVRSAVPSGTLRADAPPGQQSLAHRPATGLVRRPGGRATARAGRHAAAPHSG